MLIPRHYVTSVFFNLLNSIKFIHLKKITYIQIFKLCVSVIRVTIKKKFFPVGRIQLRRIINANKKDLPPVFIPV